MTTSDPLSYEWRLDGALIPGAVGPAYKVRAADEGGTLSCTVTKSTSAGTGSATSLATTPVSAPAAGSLPGLQLAVAMGNDGTLFNSADRGLAQYRAMRALGITGVRLDAGNYSGGAVPVENDETIKAALAAGLEVLLILDDVFDDLGSTTEFVSFCENCVSYYAPLGIHDYEVINEVNMAQNWSPTRSVVNPAAYVALLTQCYAAIHGADPMAQVLFSGLAAGVPDGAARGSGDYATELSPSTFVSLAYAAMGEAGSAGCYDIMNVHPYTYPTLPSALDGYSFEQCLNPVAMATGPADLPSVRAQMIVNGDAAKPIWVTEFGAPTGSENGYTPVSTADEAAMYASALSTLSTNGWTFVTRFYAFNWADNPDGYFGLVDSSYEAKPALAAFLAG